jgi:hypothetical protein
MIQIEMNDFIGIDEGNKVVDLTEVIRGRPAIQMKPVQLHHKANGAIGDKPSFVIVMAHPDDRAIVFGQISLDMLTKALDQVGYSLTKK